MTTIINTIISLPVNYFEVRENLFVGLCSHSFVKGLILGPITIISISNIGNKMHVAGREINGYYRLPDFKH